MADETKETQSTAVNPTPSEREAALGIMPSHGISINVPAPVHEGLSNPPLPVRHMSAPTYQSPLRHHQRAASRTKGVKETLNARSHYGSSEDDGGAIHRINQYIIKQEIGRGSFGAVHLAVDQYGNEYAVKEFSKSRLRKRAQSNLLRKPNAAARRGGHLAAGLGFNSPLHRHSSSDKLSGENNSLSLIKEEIAIMKKLNHHNLVALNEVLDDPQEDSLYMVMEMCKKGVVMKVSLEERAEPYEEELCRCWFRDMILGIEYLHAQGIIHRDIKPDNCLITHDDVLKIVDFGVSEMFETESEMHTAKSAGSPAFMPPELCVVKHGPVSGKAADIWSMGVTLYCLRYGRIPFEKGGVMELYESIKNDNLLFEEESNKDFEDMMRRLCEKDPDKRITMDQLRAHAWVTKNGTDPLLSAEENCANIVEPPTETEMNHAITGNVSQLMTVMKAVRRFKKLARGRRPHFMEGIFGRESRIVQPPSSLQRSSQSVDTPDRLPVESAITVEGVHRDVDDEVLKAPSDFAGLEIDTPAEHESTVGSGHREHETEAHHRESRESIADLPLPKFADPASPDALPRRSRTFPIDEHAKGHAHDPLEDRRFLNIGPGAGVARADDPDELVVCESPSGVEDDIYELAYQEEMRRILAERDSAGLILNRRVEHIDRLRQHPNVIASSLNHAIDFAGSTARRMEARARSGGFAMLVRDARDKARQAVNDMDREIRDSKESSLLSTSTKAGASQDSNETLPSFETNSEDHINTNEESPGGVDGPAEVATPSKSPQPQPEVARLRDAAKATAGTLLKSAARRLDETASRIDARGGSQQYRGT